MGTAFFVMRITLSRMSRYSLFPLRLAIRHKVGCSGVFFRRLKGTWYLESSLISELQVVVASFPSLVRRPLFKFTKEVYLCSQEPKPLGTTTSSFRGLWC